MRKESLAFLSGVLLFQQFSMLPDIRWALLLPILLVLLLVSPSFRVLIVAAAAFCWTLWHANSILATALDPSLEGRDLIVTGRVADIPEVSGNRVRFPFEIETLTHEGKVYSNPGRVRLSWYGKVPDLWAGEGWRLTVRLKRPHGFMNPGGFDYEGWLYQKGLRATGYVRQDPASRRLPSLDESFSLHRLRQELHHAIQRALPDNGYRGIVTALAIGLRSGITAEQWQFLTVTGTSHLVAISGLHIGLVAGMVFFMVRLLWARAGPLPLYWPSSKAAAIAAILGAALYAALAGFSIPTQRALIMVGVVMVGLLLQRRRRPSDILAAALLFVLLFDPLAVMSAGFWLSFLAVALILLTMSGRLTWRGWPRWVRVHLVMGLGLAPVLLILFQQVPLLSPVANVIAVPVVSLVVVPLVLAGTLCLAVFPPAGSFLLDLAALALDWLMPFLGWLSRQDLALWRQHVPPAWTVLPAAIGMLLLLAPRGFPARWTGVLWMVPLFLSAPQQPRDGEAWFTLLDVGQGLAAVVRTRDHVMVYDTGPRYSERFDAGSAVLLPYFRQQGIQYVDLLVLGHGDADHVGGAQALFDNFPIGRVISSVPDRIGRPGVQHCHEGQHWQWNGIDFRVMHPAREEGRTGNDASCVLQIGTPGNRILLTGDIERPAEGDLVRRYGKDLRARFLVAPHHGSRTSSSQAFLEAVDPRYVLIPVGYRNRFRLPAAEVLRRYDRAGITRFDSARHGAISLRIDASGGYSKPRSYREESRRYWSAVAGQP